MGCMIFAGTGAEVERVIVLNFVVSVLLGKVAWKRRNREKHNRHNTNLTPPSTSA